MNVKRTRNAAHQILYHFVWCPKYRRPVLEGGVSDRLTDLISEKVNELDGQVIELIVRPDHVHLFGEFSPRLAPYQIMHRIKGYTSHVLRDEFPELNSRLPSLWTRAYYVGTAGNVSSETIRKYIEAQKNV